MPGIPFYEDCLIGASNSFLKYWCANPDIITQEGTYLFLFLVLIVSLLVGKKKGWKWGVASLVGGTGIVILISLLVQTLIAAIIWR